MPIKPTKELNGYRIEFNKKEREMLDTIVTTQSLRNVMAGFGAILGPIAVFASTPAGIAVFAGLITNYLEQRAQRLEWLVVNDPDQLSNIELRDAWLLNAIGPPLDLFTDPVGGVTERAAILRETASRVSSWAASIV